MSDKYIGTCEACEMENILVEDFSAPPPYEGNQTLCNVCASTYLPGWINNPSRHSSNREVIQAINHGINLILKELRK